MNTMIQLLKTDLKNNGGKISPDFINLAADNAEAIHIQPTANTRICVLKLETGHEVVGIAQVLDAANDVEATGKQIAFNRAKDQLWSVFGSIAKVL